jgi:hypothetical protein
VIPDLVYLDRYRNEGTRVYSPHAAYSEAKDRYRPNADHGPFQLPLFELPRDELNVYEAGPGPEIRDSYLRGENALLAVHPQVLEEAPEDSYLLKTRSLGPPAGFVRVVPSASTRTVYVKANEEDGAAPGETAGVLPSHALKVHFPFRISRYGRRMRDEVVEQAVNVSRELEAGVELMDHRFAFLREVLGVTHKELEPGGARGENWGYLVRDLRPFPEAPEERTLVPGFALYGRDFFDPSLPPLILELIGERDPLSYVIGEILLPIIRHWIQCFQAFGFILEPHGQNVLLEMGETGLVKRVVHRDLSPGIDMRLRRAAGLEDGPLNDYNRMETGTFASIAYDRMMGGHFFQRLLDPVMGAHPEVREEDFREPCREEFGRLFPDHDGFLPRTIQYFSEERDAFGKPLFEDTGMAPSWRP